MLNSDNIVIFFIIMESNADIEQSKFDLQNLLSEGGLPPKMQAKLQYLLTSIEGSQINKHLVDVLPQFQKMSLQMMDMNTKVSLFNSIVRCLAGRQVYIYFSAQKATLKTESSSASSLNCFLFGDSKVLRISKSKEGSNLYYQMFMEKLMVSKIYRQEKKKYSFGIAYEDVKYRLRFQEQGKCARVHAALLGIIRQKRDLKAKQSQKQPLSANKQDLQFQQEAPQINYEQKMIQEERQFLQLLKQKANQIDLEDSERFQLFKNTDWGKILVNRKQNEVRILMFMQKCTLVGLIQSYIQFSAWNTQVDSFRVINKIRRNTYLCSLTLKRQMFTAARHTYIIVSYFKQCKCLSVNKLDLSEKAKQKHYLILNSVPAPEDWKGQKSTYPFTINQIIQFCRIEENNNVFINLHSKMDFNVFEYLNNSLDKSLAFLGEIGSINLLSRERDLLKNNKKEFFQFNACICEKKVQSKIIFQGQESQAFSERKQSISLDLDQNMSRIKELQISEWSLKEIQEVLDNHNIKQLVEKRILNLIGKKIYQKYYLKQHFDMESKEQPYISSGYHLNQRQNFFQLGQSWKFNSSQDLIFINEQIIKLQKGALKLIVKQITSNLMAGKSIMTMSLPVQLFSDDSALQGFAKTFGFVPFFMKQAVKQSQIVEQIKYVFAAFMFIFACAPSVTKPFNPILGQTYQAYIGGIPMYFQQTSHHPPISTFLMKNDQFQAHGNFDLIVDLGMNSAYTKFPTILKVKIYHTNTQYLIRYPDIDIGGIMFGDRILKLVGKGYVLQKNSGIYLQSSNGKAKKGLYQYKEKVRQADLAGGIFQITPEAIARLLNIDKKKSVQGIKPEEAIKRYSLITGKWYGDLYFDGIRIKSFKDGPFPLKPQRPTVLLPSDCTYRLDIIYRRWRDFKTSNEEKEVLQNLQRKDRKLRQKNNPQRH